MSTHPRREHFLALPDGRRLHYVDQAGPGRALLFLHGIGVSWAVWQGTLRRLAGKYRIIAADLRGHGESDWLPPRRDAAGPDTDYEPAAFAEDIALLMDHLGLHDSVVAGSSLGGLVALFLGAQRPARVAGLCLIDPPLGFRREGYLELFRRLREAKQAGPSAIAAVLAGGGPGVDAPWVKPMARMIERVDPRVLAAAEIGRAGYADLEALFPQVHRPVLLMQADSAMPDAALTPRAAERALRLLPDARLVEFPGAGHAIHATQAARFVEVLTEFVDGLPGG